METGAPLPADDSQDHDGQDEQQHDGGRDVGQESDSGQRFFFHCNTKSDPGQKGDTDGGTAAAQCIQRKIGCAQGPGTG